jgi:anti-anti-sigma factor
MTVRAFQANETVWAIGVTGRIDGAVAQAVEEAFRSLFAAQHHWVVMDFSQTTYLSSAGIRALIVVQRTAQAAGGEVRLAAAPPNVQDVMRMAGLEQLFIFYPSVAEALSPQAAE